MLLSSREKEDLNRAIFEYLSSANYEKTAEAFMKECTDQVTKKDSENGMTNILERKWVTIPRLQKKIGELERENEQLKSELASVAHMKKTTVNREDTENLFPKAPASHTFTGHKGYVVRVAMHPMYTQLASVGEDGMIKLWDYEAKKYEGSMQGHTQKINDIAFDANGTYLASASGDMLVKVWDVDSKNCVKTFTGHDHSVSSVRWKNTSDFILSASRDESIKLWELATGYCVRTFKGHEKWVRMAVFNHDCSKIASCSDDNSVMLWNAQKDLPVNTLYGHSQVVECVMFVNANEGKKAIHEAKYNAEGKTVLESSLSEVEKSKKKLQEGNKVEDVTGLEFIISASRDKSVRIWSGQTGNTLLVIEGHNNWVRGLAMHHSNKHFYSCGDDKSLKVWNLATGKLTAKIDDAHSNFVNDVAAHQAYLFVVTCSSDATIKLWECK